MAHNEKGSREENCGYPPYEEGNDNSGEKKDKDFASLLRCNLFHRFIHNPYDEPPSLQPGRHLGCGLGGSDVGCLFKNGLDSPFLYTRLTDKTREQVRGSVDTALYVVVPVRRIAVSRAGSSRQHHQPDVWGCRCTGHQRL